MNLEIEAYEGDVAVSFVNWLVYSKNNIVVADVESEEEALEVVEDLTEDPWWKDDGPFRIEMML